MYGEGIVCWREEILEFRWREEGIGIVGGKVEVSKCKDFENEMRSGSGNERRW